MRSLSILLLVCAACSGPSKTAGGDLTGGGGPEPHEGGQAASRIRPGHGPGEEVGEGEGLDDDRRGRDHPEGDRCTQRDAGGG